jgi:hypothetical protein
VELKWGEGKVEETKRVRDFKGIFYKRKVRFALTVEWPR